MMVISQNSCFFMSEFCNSCHFGFKSTQTLNNNENQHSASARLNSLYVRIIYKMLGLIEPIVPVVLTGIGTEVSCNGNSLKKRRLSCTTTKPPTTHTLV